MTERCQPNAATVDKSDLGSFPRTPPARDAYREAV